MTTEPRLYVRTMDEAVSSRITDRLREGLLSDGVRVEWARLHFLVANALEAAKAEVASSPDNDVRTGDNDV